MTQHNDTPEQTADDPAIPHSQSDAKYRLIVDNALEGIMVMQEGHVTFGNPKLLEITEYSLDELRSTVVTDFVHPDDRAMVHDRYTRRLSGENVIPEYSFRMITKSGKTKWIYIKVARVEWDGKPATLSFMSDITDKKALEDELKQLSQIDALTGIANRRVFETKLENEWRRAMRHHTPLSILMIDIDYFKAYNDYYGHPAGDDCLRTIAGLLAQMVDRPGDLIARYGGEEFVVILPDTDLPGAAMMAENMRSKIESLKIQHKHPSICGYITISLGVCSTVPGGDSLPKQLVQAADRALYRAKENGRNMVVSIPDIDAKEPNNLSTVGY